MAMSTETSESSLSASTVRPARVTAQNTTLNFGNPSNSSCIVNTAPTSSEFSRLTWGRAMKRALLTVENLQIHREQTDGMLRDERNRIQVDACLHAFVPTEKLAVNDADKEVVGPDWDLPAATLDPDSQRIRGGLRTSAQKQVRLPPKHCVELIVRWTNPAGIYVFPIHGMVILNADHIADVEMRPDFVKELHEQCPYSFDFGSLCGNLCIRSNVPLPKVWINYKLYTPSFPDGFFSTGAQKAWFLDQRNPVRLGKDFIANAPRITDRAFQSRLGSCFTFQPINTVSSSANILPNPHVQTFCKRDWELKVRAGNMLLKLQSVESTFMTGEVEPWHQDSPHLRSQLPYLPLEGFWNEQNGQQSDPWQVGVLNGIRVTHRGNFRPHPLAQLYEGCKAQARTNYIDACIDSDARCDVVNIAHARGYRPTPVSDNERSHIERQILEHWNQGCAPCRLNMRIKPWAQQCMCYEWSDVGCRDVDMLYRDQDLSFNVDRLSYKPDVNSWLDAIDTHFIGPAPGLGGRRWTGESAFYQSNRDLRDLSQPTFFRVLLELQQPYFFGKSGLLEDDLTPPSPAEYLAPFSFQPGGTVYKAFGNDSHLKVSAETTPAQEPSSQRQSLESIRTALGEESGREARDTEDEASSILDRKVLGWMEQLTLDGPEGGEDGEDGEDGKGEGSAEPEEGGPHKVNR